MDDKSPYKAFGRILLYLLGGWLGLWTHNTTKQINQITSTQQQHTKQLQAGVVGLPTISTPDNRSSSELLNIIQKLITQKTQNQQSTQKTQPIITN